MGNQVMVFGATGCLGWGHAASYLWASALISTGLQQVMGGVSLVLQDHRCTWEAKTGLHDYCSSRISTNGWREVFWERESVESYVVYKLAYGLKQVWLLN